jgi:signal transduction histidine kinase
VLKNGGLAWTENTAFVIRSHDGHPKYLVGVVLDITKRKEVEEALSSVNRRLIEAQEQDRKRIGRDLHDDINQRLAMLAVDLDELQRNLPELAAETLPKLNEFRGRIMEICSGVQSISRQLHLPQLEYLGVGAAMRNFCREFAEKQRVEIQFTQDNIPELVPHEISLCLFRVLQEGLHNAAKHSHVRRFNVALGYAAGQIHLMITDRGRGFDPQTAVSRGGLGLISMRERVRIVNGTFTVDSKPMSGTTIHVCIPVQLDDASKAAVS